MMVQDGEEELACHCPNPGRLVEFLFPGERMILEKRVARAPGKAKTDWTIGGVYYRDGVVPLFAARANRAAALILPEIIPGLRELCSEYPLGASRFDFFALDAQKRPHLIEVKACSLVEDQVAMFPDAPSLRAMRHLEELAALSREGYVGHILFVIVHGNPQVFIPNLHTDPLFAAGLSRSGFAPEPCEKETPPAAGKVRIHASLLRCDPQGEAVLIAPYVPVDLGYGALAESNRGNYLLLLEVPRETVVQVGALGLRTFVPGWYVYTGSAQRHLSQRLLRHLRKVRKHPHWHVDYLTPHTQSLKALPIMAYENQECALAQDLEALGGTGVPGFGCSDCHCQSHLFYFPAPPLGNRAFVDLLLRYRAHPHQRV
jgi:sugar fermentation stimulation protein A